MTTDADTNVADSSATNSEAGRFYVLSADYRGEGPSHGLIFQNEDRLLGGRALLHPTESGVFDLPERPLLIHAPEKGMFPRDLESGISGNWLVSERLRMVMEQIDSVGLAFFPCDLMLSDGAIGPRHYLCRVIRTIDALDEAGSSIEIRTSNEYATGKVYAIRSGDRLKFNLDAVGRAHIFYTPFSTRVFCDRELHDAIVAGGFSGVWFRDAGNYQTIQGLEGRGHGYGRDRYVPAAPSHRAGQVSRT